MPDHDATCPDCGGQITRQPGTTAIDGARWVTGWCDDCGIAVRHPDRWTATGWETIPRGRTPWAW